MERSKQLSLFSSAPTDVERQAPNLSTSVITACPDTLPPNARWREIRNQHLALGFMLVRSKRKSIGLVINQDGLQIRAPAWVSLSQIDAAVIQRADWILEKLRLRQERDAQNALATTQWKDGGVVPYMGARIVLQLDPSYRTNSLQGEAFSPVDGDVLQLALPKHTDNILVRDTVYHWLQLQALVWFEQRLQHFLALGNLTMTGWRISSAKTRWGSCTSKGRIMLNWRLIHFKHDLIDYVVAHEVAHLREMNHSPAFWDQVKLLLPDYKSARKALRHYHPGLLPLFQEN